jgi:glutaredoxin
MTGAREVVLFGRRGCHLCDEARAVLMRVHQAHPFAFRECDIESDERLLGAYLERIPVVTIDGLETFELVIDESELMAALGPSPQTH